MLVHNPHNLAGVHSRAAAQSNNAVGLEGGHSLGALFSAGQSRIRSNVVESGMSDAHFV